LTGHAAPPCRRLEWDSHHFGVAVGQVDRPRATAAELDRALDWCAAERIDCLYLLADPASRETVAAAEARGFGLVAQRVTLELGLEGGQPSAGFRPEAAVRPHRPGDLPALEEIAARAYRGGSRFYNDPRFPDPVCDELYRQWIVKSCGDPAGAVWVAEVGGEPAGYLTCEPDGAEGRIGLVAVADGHGGRGLGRRLVAAGLGWFGERGASRVWVRTEGANLTAQRLYQRSGFVTCSMELWYHRWTEPS
jgi:dTDP-4-amino-4,6-dideoxy-D-galactose acyltransferase